jgi:hypothetical protein
MPTPAKTAFMDLVETALKTVSSIATINSVANVNRRPAIPTDWDNANLPMICYSYQASRKRRDSRIQFVDFSLQIEVIAKRQSDTLDAETVGESVLSDIEAKLIAIEGNKPCIKIVPASDDILEFDEALDKARAVAIYEVTIAHNYGDSTSY